MQAPGLCSVRSQSAARPSSASIDFVVPGLDGQHFVAWGTEQGCINIGVFEVPHDDGSGLSIRYKATTRHLVTLQVAFASPVTHLAYGGGPHVLLAAATAQHLTILSLESLLSHAFNADTSAATGHGGNGIHGWELSPSVHLENFLVGSCVECEPDTTGDIIAASWTQQLDGVLVSHAGGALKMWQLRPLIASDAKLNAYEHEHTAAALCLAWAVDASEPQDLLSAGVSVEAPSASACTVGERCANIWWPEDAEISPNNGSAAAQAVPSGAKSARRERLKHTCQVLGIEWCPGVLRKDILDAHALDSTHSGNIKGTAEGSDDKKQDSAAAATASAVEDHPALMTLGADGSVRLWVEMLVIMQQPASLPQKKDPIRDPKQEPAVSVQQQPLLDSYFAMTLVVDPPPATELSSGGEPCGNNNNGGSRRTVATWVHSTGTLLGRVARGSASASVLWLITAAALDNNRGMLVRLHAVRGLSPVVVASFPGSMTGASTINAGAKRPQAVLWGQHVWHGAGAGAGSDAVPLDALSFPSFSAWMSAEDDFPRVTCFEARGIIHRRPNGSLGRGNIVAAGITFATVLSESPVSPTSLHQQLEAVREWHGSDTMHGATICALQCTDTSLVNSTKLIASLDTSGDLFLWNMKNSSVELATAVDINNAAKGALEETNNSNQRDQRGGGCLHWLSFSPAGALDGKIMLAAVYERTLRIISITQYTNCATEAILVGSVALQHDIIALQPLDGFAFDSLDPTPSNRILAAIDSGSRHASPNAVDDRSLITLLKVSSSGAIEIIDGGPHPVPSSIGGTVISAASLAHTPGGMLLGTSQGKVHSVILSKPSGAFSERSLASPPFSDIVIQEVACAIEVGSSVVSIAVDHESGMAAAASCGPGAQLVIWSPSSSDTSRDISSSRGTSGTALERRGAGEDREENILSSRVALQNESAATVAWVPGLVAPCVVVGNLVGDSSVYAPTRESDGWKCIAALPERSGTGGISALCVLERRLVAASGPCVLELSERILVGDGEEKTLSRHVLEASGPVPQYHPSVLRYLLLSGRRDAAAAIISALSTWLPQYQRYQEAQQYARLYRMTSEHTETEGSAGGAAAAGSATIVAEGTTPKVASEEAHGPPAFPSISLESFVDPELKELPQKLVAGWERAAQEARVHSEKQKNTDTVTSVTAATTNQSLQVAVETRSRQNDSTSGAIASGTLDLSSFGMDFGGIPGGSGSNSQAMSTTASSHQPPPPPPVQYKDPVASGALDLAAFGMSVPEQEPPVVPPPQIDSGINTGMLDMGAFGFSMPLAQEEERSITGEGEGEKSREGEPANSSAPPASSVSNNLLESGMLDLAAFGMGMPPSAHDEEQVLSSKKTSVATTVPTPMASSYHESAMKQPSNALKQSSAPLAPPSVAIQPPQQKQHPATALQPFPEATVAALIQSLGARNSLEDASADEMNDELISFRAAGAPAQAPPLGGVLWLRPSEPLPSLTYEETREVLAIATLFSAASNFQSGLQLDSAACHFLGALTLACTAAGPSDNNDDDDDAKNNDSASDFGYSSAAGSSASLSSLWPSRSSNSLASISTTGGGGGGGGGSIKSQSQPQLASSQSQSPVLLKQSRSMRNAAGVEYTLPPSMSSSASLTLLDTPQGGSGSDGRGAMATAWGLAPGVDASTVFWGLLSHCPESLLEHSVERLHARRAAEAQKDQASAVEMDSGAAFAALPKNSLNSGRGEGPATITWPTLRSAGAGFWLRDQKLLQKTAEAVAKSQFAAKRSADDAALLYMALGKQAVLHGLYRSTQQAKQAEFLSRDFTQEKHRHAACKNAYVLLGKHRHELAAAFFILGGCPQDAISVCAREIGDVQLALVVARLLHGPGSPAECSVVARYVLPLPSTDEDKTSAAATAAPDEVVWATAVGAWLLGHRTTCMDALVQQTSPLSKKNENAHSSTLSSHSLAQTLHALALIADSKGCGGDQVDSSAANNARDALRRWCGIASQALQDAGLPAAALQAESIAALCSSNSSVEIPSLGDQGVVSSSAMAGDVKRVAWACAAGLLAQPTGAATSPAATAVFERQLSALRALGIPVSSSLVSKRLKALQCAVQPVSGGVFGGGGAGFGGSGFASTGVTPRAAGSGGALFRQLSLETAHSTHSATSSTTRRASMDGNGMRSSNTSSNKPSGSGGGPLGDGSIVFHVDGEAIHAVCCCPLMAPDVLGRPVIVATPHHGLLEFASQAAPVGAPQPLLREENIDTHSEEEEEEDFRSDHNMTDPQSPVKPSPGGGGGIFSHFLSQIFDQSSWAADPLEQTHSASDGDIGLLVAGAMASATSGVATGASPRHTVLFAPQAERARAVVAHPSRQLFLSGCTTSGRIHLWQFGGPRALAAFTPIPVSDLSAAQAETGLLSFSARFARSTSLTSRMGNWGGPRAIAFADSGERFAAVGEGGVVATWRLGGGTSRPADLDGAVCAEWWHHCLNKEGRAVSYVGGSSSVLAVGGKCSKGNISLWDAASPPTEACVGRIGQHHSSSVTSLCTLPGGWLLAAADTGGALSLSDVRMLGGSAGGARVLWSVRAAKGAVNTLCTLPLGGADRPRALALGAASGGGAALVTGGDDGVVRVWNAATGKLRQSMEGAHQPRAPRRIVLSGSDGGAAAGVTGLAVCDEGVMSCGADGVVKLYPLNEQGALWRG